jgi:glycosyltransferase involved in cell wall biosynthesis
MINEYKKRLIIIPAYNEAKNIEKVISSIQENAVGFDYIIINDCSTDNTKSLCRMKKFNILNLPTNLGIGGGVQTGYKYALENNYDIAVQLDGDGQHDPKYLNSMLEVLQNNEIDMVIGSRYIDKEGFQSTQMRRIGGKVLSSIIKLVTGKKITDPTSGLRMVTKPIIEDFCKYYPQDYPEPESIVNMIRIGYKVMEIPVKMLGREEGSSSINFMKSIYYMIKVSLAIIIDSIKPKRRR